MTVFVCTESLKYMYIFNVFVHEYFSLEVDSGNKFMYAYFHIVFSRIYNTYEHFLTFLTNPPVRFSSVSWVNSSEIFSISLLSSYC